MSTEDCRQPDHLLHPETRTEATNSTPTQPATVDRIAQECAEKVCHEGCLLDRGVAYELIAAAIAKAVEQKDGEIAQWKAIVKAKCERLTALGCAQDASGNWYNAREAERDTLRSEVERLRELLYKVGICPTCGEEMTHSVDEPFSDCKCGTTEDCTGPSTLQKLRAALEQAEGALKTANRWGELGASDFLPDWAKQQWLDDWEKWDKALASLAALKPKGP